MSKYYSEGVVKDIPARQKVLDSVDNFLEKKRQEAIQKRSDFFNLDGYLKNPNIYRNKFIDMLGFPLKESRDIKSVEEEFVASDNNVDIFRLHFTFDNGLYLFSVYIFSKRKTLKTRRLLLDFTVDGEHLSLCRVFISTRPTIII